METVGAVLKWVALGAMSLIVLAVVVVYGFSYGFELFGRLREWLAKKGLAKPEQICGLKFDYEKRKYVRDDGPIIRSRPHDTLSEQDRKYAHLRKTADDAIEGE